MGRPRKSDAVKRATGTLQKCRSKAVATSARDRSVSPEFLLTEQPPVGLTKDARAFWKLAVTCAPKGLLLATDLSVLERWARNYALYRRLAKAVEHDGTVRTVVTAKGDEKIIANPDVKLLIQLQAVLAACEKELGFTPCSRARVNVSTDEDTQNDFDDFP